MNFTSDFTASAFLCVIRGEIPQLHNACLAATANSLVKFTNIPLIFLKNLILILNRFYPGRRQSHCFFVWDFEFWSRAAQALAPRVVICLLFGICYLGFQYVNELPTKQILSGANQRLIMNQDSLT